MLDKKEISYWRKTVERFGLNSEQMISGEMLMKFIETIEEQNDKLEKSITTVPDLLKALVDMVDAYNTLSTRIFELHEDKDYDDDLRKYLINANNIINRTKDEK